MIKRKADSIRLAQCLCCARDPLLCGATDEDEDQYGLCLKHLSIFKGGKYDKTGVEREDHRETR